MRKRTINEQGSALVLALAVLAGLALMAVIVASIATSSKWTAQSEYTHSRAFYSADAASEAAINWIRLQTEPPDLVGQERHVYQANDFKKLRDENKYKYDVRFARKRFRPGWSVEYMDYEYVVDADGTSAQESEAAVELRALRLFREGY